jgi:hypothetical protein
MSESVMGLMPSKLIIDERVPSGHTTPNCHLTMKVLASRIPNVTTSLSISLTDLMAARMSQGLARPGCFMM